MKKHHYRSTKLKDIEWEVLQEKASGQPLIFPVDAAKHDYYGALMTRDHEVLITIAWEHPQQTGLLADELVKRFADNQLELIIEPTGTYGDPVRNLFKKLNIPYTRPALNGYMMLGKSTTESPACMMRSLPM